MLEFPRMLVRRYKPKERTGLAEELKMAGNVDWKEEEEEEEAIYGEESYWASAVRPSRRRSTIEERIAETMLPPCVSSIDILRRSALNASSSWQKRNESTAKRRTAKKRSGQGRRQTNDEEEGETEEKGEKNVVCGSPWLEDKAVLSWWQWLRFLCFFLLSSPDRYSPNREDVQPSTDFFKRLCRSCRILIVAS